MGIILKEDSVIYNFNGNNDSLERNKKEQEYLEYIEEHIRLVKRAFVLYFAPLYKKYNISTLFSDEEFHQAIYDLATIIDTHDASKFSDAEFDGYRAKYYPTSRELTGDDVYKGAVDQRYEECWKHHYTTNDHHPAYWVNPETGIARDMSLRAIIEMICDWEAMSLKFNSDTIEWYESDKSKDERNAMSVTTKQIVENLLYDILHK